MFSVQLTLWLCRSKATRTGFWLKILYSVFKERLRDTPLQKEMFVSSAPRVAERSPALPRSPAGLPPRMALRPHPRAQPCNHSTAAKHLATGCGDGYPKRMRW